MEEALKGLPAPKPTAFGSFADPQHVIPQGQAAPTPRQLQVFPVVLLVAVPIGEPCELLLLPVPQRCPITAAVLHLAADGHYTGAFTFLISTHFQGKEGPTGVCSTCLSVLRFPLIITQCVSQVCGVFLPTGYFCVFLASLWF